MSRMKYAITARQSVRTSLSSYAAPASGTSLTVTGRRPVDDTASSTGSCGRISSEPVDVASFVSALVERIRGMVSCESICRLRASISSASTPRSTITKKRWVPGRLRSTTIGGARTGRSGGDGNLTSRSLTTFRDGDGGGTDGGVGDRGGERTTSDGSMTLGDMGRLALVGSWQTHGTRDGAVSREN